MLGPMKRFDYSWPELKWVDIEGANTEDLVALGQEFPVLPLSNLMGCLDPEHLPTAEFCEDCLFVVLRHHDLNAKSDASTMQELTTKLVLFVTKNLVVTLHRTSLPSIEDNKKLAVTTNHSATSLVRSLAQRCIKSFEAPLDGLDAKTTVIEQRVFALKRKNILREGYIIKRKASSYKKIFKFTSDVFQKVPQEVALTHRDMASIRDPLAKLVFYAEELYEDINGLLNLHLSLMAQKTNDASYRTNEVMRVLTVFSIFFLPLNFITGIYGMNFESMPELKHEHGYYLTLSFMLVMVIGITFWVYKKGWLKKEL
jgi:magnesium transporter